jgi:pimeloyl-ACP methyl ester carboxylesterase
MNVNCVFPPRPARRGRVIALHCSGGGASQWSYLAEALGGRYEVAAPEHYGSEGAGAWAGEHAFTLADEAVRSIAVIDRCADDKVHLVGHSYGGGVALNVALARPDRIASMALYEPSAFHLLPQLGERGAQSHAEITGVARNICQGVVTGDYRGAVAAFVDYWNGPGSWNALRPAVQSALIRWAPKGPLDFRALIDDPTPADAYRNLTFPVLVLRGERAPSPTRTIAEALADLLPASRLVEVAGAGHMGPLTHAPEVSAHIVRHITEADAGAEKASWWGRRRSAVSAVPATGWRRAEAAS